MFNLSRYFSTVSFILIVLAAGVLGPLYRQLSLQQITELAESRNVAMVHIFENSLRQPLEQLLVASLGRDADALRNSAEVTVLRDNIVALMRNTSLVQVRIHNRLGVTVFSLEPGQIGEEHLREEGFRTAMTGFRASELKHYSYLASFTGDRRDIDVLASYIPAAGGDGAVDGVFELYQEVTPFMQQLQRSLWWVTAGIFAVFALLYLMQYVVVRRAQRILEEQEGKIKAARDTLELQVEARTEELKRTNQQLQGEIGERRQAESKLNYLAYHDPLTGLANRRCFIERLEESLRESAEHGYQMAVLFVDLDQFKQVNDSLGHGVGDELLVSVAARLSDQLRLVDMLSRLGGDEFICLMERVRGEEEVAIVANEIIDAFDVPFRLGDHELFLSASVGVSLYPRDGASVLELMRNADSAMYRAKAIGRGHFHFYTPEMTVDAQERIRMENLLRRAVEHDELRVVLQPQVDAASGRLAGAEALVRWESPELGAVMPSRFIPLAEDSGIIVPLGNWVLRETCRLVAEWAGRGFLVPTVSVNLSVKQLERPEFVKVLADILDQTGLEPARLKLELTESVLMGVGDPQAVLDRLGELGIGLALDDFGTGYSSLSYLKMLPIQQIKIDRSFVSGIGRSRGDEAIIRTVMQLAASLSFEVVAEGVETQQQAEFLAALGCHQLQGELHGKAVPPGEFFARWAGRA